MAYSRPLSYLSTECVVPYMDFYSRNSLSRRSPTFEKLYGKIPLTISRLHIRGYCCLEIKIDGVTFKISASKTPQGQIPLNTFQITDLTGRVKYEEIIKGDEYRASLYLFNLLFNVDLKNWTIRNLEIECILSLQGIPALVKIAQNVILGKCFNIRSVSFKHPRLFLKDHFSDLDALLFVDRSKYYARQSGYRVTAVIDSRERAIKIFNLIKTRIDYQLGEIPETRNTSFPECLTFNGGWGPEPLEGNVFLEEVEDGSLYHLHAKIEQQGWAASQQV